MSNENLLGAPTEGLGQTVTFASNVRGAGSQLGANGFSPLRAGVAGVQGGQVQFAQGPQAVQDPTISLLVKAGQDMLAPQIEKAKTKAFLTGMQQVAGGRALADVAKDEPWYMQVFGDSDLLAGARAYTQQTKAQETVMALQDNMEELRKLPGEQFNAHVKKLLDSNMTGDAVTDATLMQSMARVLPGLYSSHAREHVKHLQFEAATAEAGMRGSAGKALQRQYAEFATNGVAEDAPDRVIADAALIGTLGKAEGRDDKSYAQGLGRTFQEWAEAGNFHAIRVATNAGFMEKVDPAMRTRLEDLIAKNAAGAINSKQGEPLQREWLDLRMAAADGAITPERLLEKVDALNKKASDVLGISEPFLPRSAVEGTVLHANQVLKQMDREAVREIARLKGVAAQGAGTREGQVAAAKAAADEEVRIRAAIREGAFYKIANGLNGPTSKMLDNVLTSEVSPVWSNPNAFDPATRTKVIQTFAHAINGGASASTLKDKLGYQIGLAMSPTPSSEASNMFLLTLQQFKALDDENPRAARKLFGDEYSRYAEAGHLLGNNLTMTRELEAARARFADPHYRPAIPDKLDKSEGKALLSAIKDKYTSWFNPNKVADASAEEVQAAIRPYVVSAPSRDPDKRAEQGLAAWELNGGTFIAGKPTKLPANLRDPQAFVNALGKDKELNMDSWDKWGTNALKNLVVQKSSLGPDQKITGVAVHANGNLVVTTDKTSVTVNLSEVGDEILRNRVARRAAVAVPGVGSVAVKVN